MTKIEIGRAISGLHGSDAVARGRNGWFHPRSAWIEPLAMSSVRGSDKSTTFDTVDLQVNSSRFGDTAPIILRLPKEEMAELAEALRVASGGESTHLAQVLKQEFPWLGTEDEIKSCADQVEILELLYNRLASGQSGQAVAKCPDVPIRVLVTVDGGIVQSVESNTAGITAIIHDTDKHAEETIHVTETGCPVLSDADIDAAIAEDTREATS